MRGTKPHIRADLDAIGDRAAPDWFSDDAAAEWDRIVPMLAKRRILTEADLGSVENYCIAIGMVREMEREIQRLGAVLKVYKIDKEGNSLVVGVRKNPAISVQSDAMNRARLLAAELGCTPVSRSRPTVEDTEDRRDLWAYAGGLV